jgi:GNAT superfamily N-acetyltransferase
VNIRAAAVEDLAAVVALVAEDASVVVTEAHRAAFAAIEADPRNEVLVGEEDGAVVACLQLTFIPGLGRGGAERAQLEAIRVREDRRGAGLGRELVSHAVDRARERGCTVVQLTSNRRRTDAHRFYASLGFEQTHAGFKLSLDG